MEINKQESESTFGSRAELMKDRHWGGLPPVGEKPILKPTQFLIEIILLMVLEIALWATYRYFSAPYLGSAFSYQFFYFHIIMAPLIHLTPIFLYWRFRLGEHGLPFLFTRKNLFTAVLIALVSVVLLYLFFQYLMVGFCALIGIYVKDSFIFAEWLTSEAAWFGLMMFTFFFIVGPVEELQHRGFLQDQINRVHRPWVGIAISAFFFGAGHLPIYFILYELSPLVALITMMYTITFALLMSLFYHWSRNIIGPIILHGFWDWQLSVYTIIFIFEDPMPADPMIMSLIMWLSAVISMTIIVFIFYLAYRLWWKSERPDGSLGFAAAGVNTFFSPEGFIARTGRRLKKRRVVRSARHLDETESPLTATLFFTGLIIIIFCVGVMGISAVTGVDNVAEMQNRMGVSMVGSNEETATLEEIILVWSTQGYNDENSESEVSFLIEERNLIEVSCTLSWTDTISQYLGGTNEPDEFKVFIVAPNNDIVGESVLSSSGSVSASTTLPDYNEIGFEDNYIGDWTIRVAADDCGDDHSLTGLRTISDNGNDWQLDYSYTYMGTQLMPEQEDN